MVFAVHTTEFKKKFYRVPTERFHGSQNKQRLFPLATWTWSFS